MDCPIYAAFKDGKVNHVDTEVFWRKDGTSFPVEYISTPIRDDKGKLMGAVVAFSDVTELKRAEEDLLDSEDRLRKIYNAAEEAIFLIDPKKNKIVDANIKASQMLGYSEQEFEGIAVKKIHPKEMNLILDIWQKIISGEVIQTGELSCTTKIGSEIPAEISFSLVTIKDTGYILAMVRNITERNEADRHCYSE